MREFLLEHREELGAQIVRMIAVIKKEQDATIACYRAAICRSLRRDLSRLLRQRDVPADEQRTYLAIFLVLGGETHEPGGLNVSLVRSYLDGLRLRADRHRSWRRDVWIEIMTGLTVRFLSPFPDSRPCWGSVSCASDCDTQERTSLIPAGEPFPGTTVEHEQ